MKPNNNQGEGDKVSARHYNRDLREFIADGKVDEAAHEAKEWVEREPDDASRAEAKAARGPRTGGVRVSVQELVEKGRSIVDRVRPIVERAADKVRARFHK